MGNAVEFWNLKRVIAAVGLSKSEIYRQIARGLFPAARPYRHNPNKRFWLSSDVQTWQLKQLPGDDFDLLLK